MAGGVVEVKELANLGVFALEVSLSLCVSPPLALWLLE